MDLQGLAHLQHPPNYRCLVLPSDLWVADRLDSTSAVVKRARMAHQDGQMIEQVSTLQAQQVDPLSNI